MRSGELNRSIVIQRAIYTTNAFNEKVQSWQELMSAWASKRDVGDGERIQAQQVSAHITTRFQFRWSRIAATINPTDRLIFENKVYEIFSCKEIGFHDGVEITAAARAEIDNTTQTVGNVMNNGGQGEAQAQGSMIVSAAGSASGQG